MRQKGVKTKLMIRINGQKVALVIQKLQPLKSRTKFSLKAHFFEKLYMPQQKALRAG